MTPLRIDNRTARRLWLERHGLLSPQRPTGSRGASAVPVIDAATDVVDALGMVQLDPIRTVARAHEHILWSRGARIRPPAFERLIEDRRVFEHFSHDAVILPMARWPSWRRQRERRAKSLERGSWGQALPPPNVRAGILERVAREGPLCSRDFERAGRRTDTWSKPPHKVALDWLWLSGELAVSHRRGFAKHYDLTERIVPEALRTETWSDADQLDRLCRDALGHLGVASVTELQRFWDAATRTEVQAWIGAHRAELVDVLVESADGRLVPAFAGTDIESRLEALPEPGSRLRVINPFDPVIRDRARLARLFGFDYRIEIYVPQAKRRYGYYVFPLLEGTRFVGRAEIRTGRERLEVTALWLESGVRAGRARRAKLTAELARFARLAGVSDVSDLPPPRAAG